MEERTKLTRGRKEGTRSARNDSNWSLPNVSELTLPKKAGREATQVTKRRCTCLHRRGTYTTPQDISNLGEQ